jgi:predicted 3-demethylubiquinone-9 3-methyltransferase (glyoxalase superfamily)
MEKIQPCLWFDNQAEEAAKYYCSVFADAGIRRVVPYGPAASQASGRPEGSVMTVEFELEGLRILGLNGGPHFKLNPSFSFFVGCNSEREIDGLWQGLLKEVRMELMKYPFAEKYGWCEDRFGVNWQLILAPRRQKIVPALLFANERYGKAEEAIKFYVSQFPDSRIEMIARDEQTKAVLHSVFTLAGGDYVFMEGPLKREFGFSPAISFIVNCESQEEIDEIWSRLSAVPEAERCGWLQDRYGVSWQIVHKDWGKMISDAAPAARERLMAAILGMKKPDLKTLQQALE